MRIEQAGKIGTTDFSDKEQNIPCNLIAKIERTGLSYMIIDYPPEIILVVFLQNVVFKGVSFSLPEIASLRSTHFGGLPFLP